VPKPSDYSLLGIRIRAFLDRPIPAIWCVISWFGATAVFYGILGILGGPVEGDASETVYSTWSISHGDFACAYPHLATFHLDNLAEPFALAAPLYPLLSGAGAALLRIGHEVAFPSQSHLGPGCADAVVKIFNWSTHSGAILPTIRLSYLVWPVLLAGIIALVRASGRGKTGWEPLVLFLVACTPPLAMCITFYFHPEDILALALAISAVAAALRRRWGWSGAFIGLACCAQPFALLVGAALLVVAPGRARIRYATGAIITAAIIDVPLIVATSGRALRMIALGSSRVGIIDRSTGGTVLWETHLHGVALFLCARIAPIAASMLLAWWATRRLGPRVLDPIPLVSLMTCSLLFRLVFEENLFGYYFMAASVSLVLLEVVRGHFRGTVAAWLALELIAFNPINAGFFSNLTGHTLFLFWWVPILILGLVVASVIVDAIYHRVRIYKLLWITVACFTGELKLWGLTNPIWYVPHWLWQIVLVPIALGLAFRPLLDEVNQSVSVRADTPVSSATRDTV
jgi:hypothetical protein